MEYNRFVTRKEYQDKISELEQELEQTDSELKKLALRRVDILIELEELENYV